MVRVPFKAPVAAGVKVTLIPQAVRAARVIGQELLWLKSPVTAIPVRVRVSLPVLLMVTVMGVLLVPTVWLENATAAGQGVTTGTVVALPFTDAVTLPVPL